MIQVINIHKQGDKKNKINIKKKKKNKKKKKKKKKKKY